MRHDANDQEIREAIGRTNNDSALHCVLAISGIRAHDILSPVPDVERDWTPEKQEAYLRFAERGVRGLKGAVLRHLDGLLGQAPAI